MAFWNWSKTAASNAGADPTINWAEGQAPSSVNDSARALMASAAMWRDDISGATVTTGSASAYSLSTFSNFTSSAALTGQMVAFTPHVTNTAIVTMTVDSVANIPLRSAPGVELPSGVLIQGTPYVATLASDGVLYLQGFYGPSPVLVPLLAGMDFWDTITPNSSFIFPAGQAINRATYAAAFARWGTTYGAGDGSTTFNVPDKTGRVSAMKEAAGSRLTSTYFGGNSAAMGAVGGGEKNALLSTNQLPQFTPSGSVASSETHGLLGGAGELFLTPPTGGSVGFPTIPTSISITSTFTGNAIGSATPNSFTTVQPTIVCNYIIRII